LSAVIINHDDPAAVLAQLEAFRRDDPAGFRRVHWLVLHNGPLPPPELPTDLATAVAVEVSPNEGYGAAVNRAIQLTDSPYLLVLNADLLPEPGTLRGLARLLRRLEDTSRIGVIGFRLLNPDGTRQGSVGRPISLYRTLRGLLKKRSRRKYLSLPDEGIHRAPWVTGASFLLARRCTEEIGTFDERFFMYYEDVDFCRRCWQAGWRVEYDPSIVFRHFHPYHGRPLTHRMVFLARHGLLTYFRKHRPSLEFWLLVRIMRWECRYRCRQDPTSRGWRQVDEMVRAFQKSGDFVRITADQLPELEPQDRNRPWQV
jgi:GT2 family glycosyltransferase